MEPAIHLDSEECLCPLSSVHCPKQTTIREQWFEAIKQSRGDVLQYFINAVEEEEGVKVAHQANDFLSVRDEDSRTPLIVATFWRSKEILLMLLDFLADHADGRAKEILDLQDARNGRTAMIEACKMGDLDMAKALREAGSTMKITDYDGKDAKAYARERGNKNLIEYLEEGLDKDEVTSIESPKHLYGSVIKGSGNEKMQPKDEVHDAVDLWDTDGESEDGDHQDSMDGAEKPEAAENEEHLEKDELEDKPSKEELTIRYNIIAEQPALKAMDEKFIARLAKKCILRKFGKDETIVKKHEHPPSMWMVQEGEVRVLGGDGDVDTVLEDKEAFGLMSVLTDEEQPIEVVANTETLMLELSQQAVAEVLKRSDPECIGTIAESITSPVEKILGENVLHARKLERRIRKFFDIPRPHHDVDMIDKRQRHIEEVPLLTNERDFKGVSLAEQYWRSRDCGHQKDLLNIPDDDESGLPQYLLACKEMNLQPQYRAVLQFRHSKFDMEGAGLTTKDALAIGAALSKNKTIETLDVAHNALYDKGCVSHRKDGIGIVDAVASNQGLRYLRMACTQITRTTAVALGQVLSQHANLTFLDLSHNLLGDKGAQAIAAGLQASDAPCLTDLDLSNNRIGNPGGVALGKMLESSSSLQVLSVSWNHMFPEGCAALIKGATQHGKLHTLAMDWNRLGQLGGDALGQFLAESESILRLDVANCGIPEISAQSLSAGIAANTCLKVAKMQWNPLGAGVPMLLTAFQSCLSQPSFRLDNCKFDMQTRQAYTVDKANPTGHYTFNLSIEQHRQQLKILVEMGMKERGENWRNEKLDEVRFSFPPSGAWEIPDAGILDFDFVLLGTVDGDGEDFLSTVDFKNLTKQINKALSPSVRIDLIKQAATRFILDADQTLAILFSLAREVERLEALIALFSRTFGREESMAKILLSCFHRPAIETLQDRLGPASIFDSVNPGGRYSFDMAKRGDRSALRTLCQTKRDFVYCSFVKATFTPHATQHAKEEVTDVEAWTSNEEGEVPWNGTLYVEFLVDKKAAAKAIALARSKSEQNLLIPGRRERRKSMYDNLPPFRALTKTGSEPKLIEEREEEEENVFDFAGAMRRTRVSNKIVAVRYPEGISGLVRVTGMKDKPFNSRWDGGLTTMLLPVEDKNQYFTVGVFTPRGTTEYTSEVVGWNSPQKTEISLEDEDEEEALELQRAQNNATASPQHAREASQQQKKPCSPSLSTQRSIDFDLAQRRAKGQRFYKPWAGFARTLEDDFVVHTIKLRDRKVGIGMMMERVKAQLGEASCINYQVDLTLPVKMHTIPRHFTVIVSPADDVNVYANTEGLPCEDNYIWRGESDGQDRIILIRPTDKNYVAAKYFITVITSRHPAQFELTVQVAPYPPTLRQANPSLQDKVASRVANSKTGRMLSSLMYYTAERKRKSAHGASVPPKATLHLRPSSAAGFDRNEFSLTGTRPSTSPERSMSTHLDDDDDDLHNRSDMDANSSLGSPGLISRGLVARPSPLGQSRRRSNAVPSISHSRPVSNTGSRISNTSSRVRSPSIRSASASSHGTRSSKGR